jgi:glutamine synthetase
MRMTMNLKALSDRIKREKIEYLDIKFTDLMGELRDVTLPAYRFRRDLFVKGVGVDGSSLTGFTKVKEGDMSLIPDPESAFIDPFFEEKTLSFLGNVMEVGFEGVGKGLEAYTRDPRFVAKKAVDHLRTSGIADDCFFGPEFEFYLFDEARFQNSPHSTFYFVDSEEAEWNSGAHEAVGTGQFIKHKGGYHIAPPRDANHSLRERMSSALLSCGVSVKYHHHEVGGASQCEIEIMPGSLLQLADHSVLTKYVVRNTAVRMGKTATFMPKPMFGEPGSGWHLHLYLVKNGSSIFYSRKSDIHLNSTALHFIGGILKHTSSLLAFTNPSTNSYKRLVPGFEAPVRATYSVGDRTAAIRIPAYQKDPKIMRIEFRPSDGASNPYLAMSAILMAGIDGIINGIDPGKPIKGIVPGRKGLHGGVKLLPRSLGEALDALEKDNEYLMNKEVFTADLIETWIAVKRGEIESVDTRPHPWEYHLYYNT